MWRVSISGPKRLPCCQVSFFFVFLLMLLFCLTFFSGSLHTVMESTKVKQASKRWKEKRESNLRQEPFYFHPEPDSVNFSPSSMTVSCGQSPSAPLESKYKAMDIRLNHHWRRLLTSQRESKKKKKNNRKREQVMRWRDRRPTCQPTT